jgi:Predicted pPIWI-associating nuclease
MPRYVTPSQLQSMIRQAEAKQRQAVNEYNAAVRRYNAEAQRAVNQHNANVRQAQRAIEDYNRAARAHNTRVHANQRRLQAEIAQLNRQRSSTNFTVIQDSTITLHTAYRRIEDEYDAGRMDAREGALADLAEAEAANSARVTNALLGHPLVEGFEVEETTLTDELTSISNDLDQRWRGALFSLNPRNPDAARHFCTSAREVVIQMIDLKAPDIAVLEAYPDCEKTETGQPIRRAKIDYLLTRYGTRQSSLAEFVETDVRDVMKLFRVFNEGTHGSAGKFNLDTLRAIKARVEGSIRFLSTVIRGT